MPWKFDVKKDLRKVKGNMKDMQAHEKKPNLTKKQIAMALSNIKPLATFLTETKLF